MSKTFTSTRYVDDTPEELARYHRDRAIYEVSKPMRKKPDHADELLKAVSSDMDAIPKEAQAFFYRVAQEVGQGATAFDLTSRQTIAGLAQIMVAVGFDAGTMALADYARLAVMVGKAGARMPESG